MLTRRGLLAGGLLAAATVSHRSVAARPPAIATRVSPILERSASASYLSAKLALDRLVAPCPASVSREIDVFVDAVRQMAGPSPTDAYKLAALRRTIYERGPWNGNRPFGYDHADPLGQSIQNKLLSTYFRTRLGNCVSMPILFLILAERVGLNVNLATAPLHVFVRYTDPAGAVFNVEATSGGHFARDAWYRENMPMSDLAIESGIYMRTLTRQESVAVIATIVCDSLMGQGRYREAVDVADVILQANPCDAYTMVKRGSAIGELIRVEFTDRYPSPASIPSTLRARYQQLVELNRDAFRHAEALGWTPAE
jgi:regulator of sirC expression with transglutaminase-like and TPR domain